MNKKLEITGYLLLGFFCCLPVLVKAQHCPFDGYTTVVIRVRNLPSGQPVPAFRLVEVAGIYTDSCSFVKGKIDMAFRSEKQVLADCHKKDGGVMSRYFPNWLKSGGNFLKGNMAVFLSMAGVDCMIKSGNDYRYTRRVFNIEYEFGGKKHRKAVSVNDMYKMCSGAGSWKRIQPVVIEPGKD